MSLLAPMDVTPLAFTPSSSLRAPTCPARPPPARQAPASLRLEQETDPGGGQGHPLHSSGPRALMAVSNTQPCLHITYIPALSPQQPGSCCIASPSSPQSASVNVC